MTRPILIIEDDADISESLKYNFEREGLAAVTAPTGEAGLSAALSERDPPRLPPVRPAAASPAAAPAPARTHVPAAARAGYHEAKSSGFSSRTQSGG